MLYDVLVVNPNPLLNLVHKGGFCLGDINRVAELAMIAEGKGVNVARVLARHGHRVVVTGFAGGHSGAWLRELIRAEGIADDLLETAAPLRMGFMASGLDASHPTTVLQQGFAVTAAECQALLAKAAAWLGSVRLVIASGSVPDTTVDGLYLELLALCNRHAVPLWLDAYGEAMKQALGGSLGPALSAPNRQEFEQIAGWERVKELHITDGEASVWVRSPQFGQWRVTPPGIKQVNPVGSGDCYLAGLAHGWLSGLPWEDRLRYAVGAGVANAMRQDVAMIRPEDVRSWLDSVALTPIPG